MESTVNLNIEQKSSSLDVADADLEDLRKFVDLISSDENAGIEQKEGQRLHKINFINDGLFEKLENEGTTQNSLLTGESTKKVLATNSTENKENKEGTSPFLTGVANTAPLDPETFQARQQRYDGILDWHLDGEDGLGARNADEMQKTEQNKENNSAASLSAENQDPIAKGDSVRTDCGSTGTVLHPLNVAQQDDPQEQQALFSIPNSNPTEPFSENDNRSLESNVEAPSHDDPLVLPSDQACSDPLHQPNVGEPNSAKHQNLILPCSSSQAKTFSNNPTHPPETNAEEKPAQNEDSDSPQSGKKRNHLPQENQQSQGTESFQDPEKDSSNLSDDWVRVTIDEPGSLYIRLQPNATRNMVFLHSFEPVGYDENGVMLRGPVEKLEAVKPGYLLWSINGQILIGRHFSFVIDAMKKLSSTRGRVLLWRKAQWDLPENLTPPGGHRQHCQNASAYVQRVALFQTTMNKTIIDLKKLRELSMMGIPDATALNGQVIPENPGLVPIASLRPLIWRILLGYLSIHPYRWKEDLDQRREFYTQCIEQFNTKPTHADLEKDQSQKQHQNEPVTRSEAELFCEIDSSESDPDTSPAPSAEVEDKSRSNSQVMDHPLAKEVGEVTGGSVWARYWQDADLNEEIRKDVVRTYPELQFFIGDEGSERLKKLERILFVYAKLNPGISYVQGMNEIVGTLLYVFASDPNEEWRAHYEADTFFCFSNLMGEMRDVYIENLDETQNGIQGRLNDVSCLLKKQDPPLWHHLQNIRLDPTYYALRWITTLMSREFDLPSTIRLWDSLFASSCRSQFLCRLSCAMILKQRETLLSGDFCQNLHLLQSYPPTDLQELLDWSHKLEDVDQQQDNGLQKKLSNIILTASIKKNELENMPLGGLVQTKVSQVATNTMKMFWPSSSTEKH